MLYSGLMLFCSFTIEPQAHTFTILAQQPRRVEREAMAGLNLFFTLLIRFFMQIDSSEPQRTLNEEGTCLRAGFDYFGTR